MEWKKILEHYHWNSFPKDSTGRVPVAVHYESDGSPYLWPFVRRCRINLFSFTQTVSASLEPVAVSADKVTMSSGPEEVSCAELGVQTETDASSLLLSVSLPIGPKEIALVDQGVQTVPTIFHRSICSEIQPQTSGHGKGISLKSVI